MFTNCDFQYIFDVFLQINVDVFLCKKIQINLIGERNWKTIKNYIQGTDICVDKKNIQRFGQLNIKNGI